MQQDLKIVSMPTIPMQPKDLYQMLIAEMRYGLSRNNHLEPWGAIRHARHYGALLFHTDRDWGLATIKQLAEEGINALVLHYLDGSNEDLVYRFVQDCIERLEDEHGAMPYNLDQYTQAYLPGRKDD